MKYKVVAIGGDVIDVILANKNWIMCVREATIDKDDGDRMYDIYPGLVLTDKNIRDCDVYWRYDKKTWKKLNDLFKKVKI